MAYNTDTTGNAATADKLKTARTINGLAAFDGTANITTSNTGWQPSDYGWLAWTHDLANCVLVNTAGTSGILYISGIKIPAATTITNVHLHVAVAGSTLTSGQCFVGIYQSGSLLASSADQSTAFASTGLKNIALSSPQSVSAGTIYVGVFCNGTTIPRFANALSGKDFVAISNAMAGSVPNLGLSSPNLRFGTANTGLTTALPNTLGTQSNSPYQTWAAVS